MQPAALHGSLQPGSVHQLIVNQAPAHTHAFCHGQDSKYRAVLCALKQLQAARADDFRPLSMNLAWSGMKCVISKTGTDNKSDGLHDHMSHLPVCMHR